MKIEDFQKLDIKVGKIIFLIIIFAFGHFSYAQQEQGTYNTGGYNHVRTYDIQYQAQDSGRYRVNSVLQNEINILNAQPVVVNLRVPILLGVRVSNLEDTWGDARANGRTHEGIDILVPRGSFIVSPTDAIVTTVAIDSGNGGNHVFTANPGGERYYFAHLDSFAQGLVEGQVLKAGDLIGYVGNTGNASAGPTHLHFGIYTDDHNAVNPFPRLILEFSLQDRMNAVAKFLDASLDSLTLARTLTSQYQTTFIEAQASGIILPTLITQVLTEKKTEALGIRRTLRIGMSGDDVKWLQSALEITADGSFGPKTRAAVIAFQIKKGLTADGVFGPKSRTAMADSSLIDIVRPAGCTGSTIYSPTTGVKC